MPIKTTSDALFTLLMLARVLDGQENVSGKDGHCNGDGNGGDVAGDSSAIKTKRDTDQPRCQSIKKATIIESLPGRERPSILFHKLLERLHERQVRFEHSKIQSQW